MIIPTLEYMAHKAVYDATHYASSIQGDPAHVILRRRRARKDSNRYEVPRLHRSYSCSTITLYIRARLREAELS